MKKLLLTGFEPFGGSNINPSAEVVKFLEGKKLNNIEIVGSIVPLIYNEIQKHINELLNAQKPNYIILLGQAPRPSISFERVAINIADASRLAYNCQTKPEDEILIKDGPVGYLTTMNIKSMVNLLKLNGIPAYVSNSAGTFGCNQIFYYCLHYLHQTKQDDIPCDFIHLPSLPQQNLDNPFQPSMDLNLMIKAIELVISSF